MAGHRWVLLLCAALVAGCGQAAGDQVSFETRAGIAEPATTTALPAPTTTTLPVATTKAPPTTRPSTIPPTTRPTVPPRPRVVTEQQWTPFAQAGEVVLHHPSNRVERDAFHESNHDGARQQAALPTAIAPLTLESRERDNPPHGAADIVVDPDVEIRSPVTGRVKRAGTYVLYCDYRDDYAVIEPDAHPGWEVKVLHLSGVRVRPGDRVAAGETVLAPRPTRLPFHSQVDETTAPPPWPHVHVEVVDPSIPDRPGKGC